MEDESGSKEREDSDREEGGDPGRERSGLLRDLVWWESSQGLRA